ncbi:AbrB/MazE/SpoVT family DNA-binding domain-containing protein [Sulfidibacter corallicola]|uniref:AbrB/MazE/SpoVT family DNA-binding domain-containing protein n=1 Tax=Sulfidibacter corallicola TaxID=2818388 RepID=A0A8A4TVF2_SULCO|nr:type II toxin-antitoxin system VapB family antitoxin [Sulfidibacter corallicola]QTD53936.1 AbrB/MazE/SpoVT family DNA-binding domain-containing protein [Sulfidibacter corallicola]
MKTARLFKNGQNQAVRLPREMEFKGVREVEIRREGRSLVLTPVKKDWMSFGELPAADDDFLADRPSILEEDRIQF